PASWGPRKSTLTTGKRACPGAEREIRAPSGGSTNLTTPTGDPVAAAAGASFPCLVKALSFVLPWARAAFLEIGSLRFLAHASFPACRRLCFFRRTPLRVRPTWPGWARRPSAVRRDRRHGRRAHGA